MINMANKAGKEKKESVVKKKEVEQTEVVTKATEEKVESKIKEKVTEPVRLNPLIQKLLKNYTDLIAKNVFSTPSNRINATNSLFRLLAYSSNLSDGEVAALKYELNKVIKVNVAFSEDVLKRKHDLTILNEKRYNELMKMILKFLA